MINKYKLDKKDWSILYELDYDSRQTCSKIAKKIGLSKEVVNYRIKNLEKENIITRYQIIVNLSKLNILQFKICIALQGLSSNNLNNIITELKQKNEIKWIVECKGKFDLMLSCETDSYKNIDIIKDEILSYFKGYIKDKEIAILVEGYTYNRDYFLNDNNNYYKSRTIMKDDEKYLKLDNLNILILKELVKDCRQTIVELAQKLNTTYRIVDYKIKTMIKQEIIIGFKIAINYQLLGIKFYKTLITLESSTLKQKEDIIKYLESSKNVIHNAKTLSSWDLEAEFEVFSEAEFDNSIRKIKDKFINIIKTIETITITKEHKFLYF